MCTSDAPASKASWVDSTCSGTVTGTAGLSFLRGTEPVIATAMTTGLMRTSLRSCSCAERQPNHKSVYNSSGKMLHCTVLSDHDNSPATAPGLHEGARKWPETSC